MEKQEQDSHPVEVLSFRRGNRLATIATDGRRHVSQEVEEPKEHDTLGNAIAYLECKGYRIDASSTRSV